MDTSFRYFGLYNFIGLTITTPWVTLAGYKLMIFFLLVPEKRVLGDNLHEISKSVCMNIKAYFMG